MRVTGKALPYNDLLTHKYAVTSQLVITGNQIIPVISAHSLLTNSNTQQVKTQNTLPDMHWNTPH